MNLFQVDDAGQLFISPAIENWDAVARCAIDTVIDLESELDTCIPSVANNRSAFMAGLILIELGMPGAEAVARLRAPRPGALFNDRFAQCLASLAPRGAS